MSNDTGLQRTLVLSESDGSQAKTQLDGIWAEEKILLVVLGGDRESVVKDANLRAKKYPGRWVVWIKNSDLPELNEKVASLRGGDSTVVVAAVALNRTVAARIRASEPLDVLSLETAFSEAEAV